MNAYDIATLPHPADRAGPDNHGWIFGMPPGIQPEQWPLDRNQGYPLMHGFTLLLPPDYRIHGPEIVAVSFFATSHNEGGHFRQKDWPAIVAAADPEPPEDVDRRFFWQAARSGHPRLFRLQDILDNAYAAILLTQAEFDGPFCLPPDLRGNGLLDRNDPPEWLVRGSAADAWDTSYATASTVNDKRPFSTIPRPPDAAMTMNRGIRWTARTNDPNAGRAPREPFEAKETGYQRPFYWLDDVVKTENYREHDWAKGIATNHIGGTMQPIQGIPSFSPYYVEFEEAFGGYNFGGGVAQLDFKDMKFDWACG